ncbi:poly(beta-D-mannuronate) C5 epimerase [Microvirga flocculans]|uniref:Poly(Beta-D-mannuronate) C5 epimerase n=1 Tax=Microvirga flocculans TaxID=217168 RepID=A0A7W6ICN5_9HYPH|nr:right-handed parallel beta-helix repeat-containing protein [Microvirga flocculans]MBB4039007.1 poly(beta-D-mannuronate) C5 epimerase [Microvirga flocculans]
MTASSRSDGCLHLRIASFLAAMALAWNVMAQDGNDITRLSGEVRQAVLSAEQAGAGTKQQAGFYQVARARLNLLEKLASEDSAYPRELLDTARSELARLAGLGVSFDSLTAKLLQTSLGDLISAPSGADRMELGGVLYQLASEQRNPASRAAALIDIGYAYRKIGAQDRALRYASLALDATEAILEIGARVDACQVVARLSIGLGASGAFIANRALSSISEPRARALARHGLAREQLQGSPFEKEADAKLIAEARRRLEGGDISGSLALVLALPDGEEREALLAGLLTSALRRRDRETALVAAQGSFKAERQLNNLAVLVADHVAHHLPLQAADIVNQWPDGSGKDSIRLSLADDLRRRGYSRMAEQLLGRIGTKKDPNWTKQEIALGDPWITDGGKTNDDQAKVERAHAVASLPDGIIEAAALIRSVSDDRLRTKAFRRMAEIHANLLAASSGEDRAAADAVESVREELGEDRQELQTRRGLTLIVTGDPQVIPERMAFPRSSPTASDVRQDVPWPEGAVVGSTFAHHNPYMAKFLEDGADGSTRLEQAIQYQGLPSPKMIVVQSGVATLGMVARALQGTDAGNLIAFDGDSLIVRAPVFVAPGARLILSRFDVPIYRLSADAGTFIANAGTVDIVDAEVVGYDEKRVQPLWFDGERKGGFRPFLLTWGDGRMNVAASTLAALGYDNALSFGLSYSSGPDRVTELRDQARPSGIMVDSLFRNFYIGFHSYESENVQVVGNEFRDSILYALDLHDRSAGGVIALNTVYGTMLRQGITLSRDVSDSVVSGNLSFDNAGSGIVLDRNSTNNIVQANSAFRNAQDGVSVFESSCNVLSNNQLTGNGRDGLKVRNSVDVGAYGNRIASNLNAGVSAYIANIAVGTNGKSGAAEEGAFTPVTALSLGKNIISSNGVGINAQGVSGLAMFGNAFVKQSRRLFGGDYRGLEGPLLRLSSTSGVLIASTCRPARPAPACRLREQGYLQESAGLPIFDQADGSDCTDVTGSVQQKAFSNFSQGT